MKCTSVGQDIQGRTQQLKIARSLNGDKPDEGLNTAQHITKHKEPNSGVTLSQSIALTDPPSAPSALMKKL
eukprot:9925929-Heterocapsa_arctica.AAC.1